MPIRPYLAGRKFAPETVAIMNAAFAEACQALNISADNPSRAMVARIIIWLVENGKTGADRLATVAVNEFRGPKAQPRPVSATMTSPETSSRED